MDITKRFTNFIDGKMKNNVLAKHAKDNDHYQIVASALNAIATPISKPGAKLTLICRLIGNALNENLTEKAQVKLGGAFVNFLHAENLVEIFQVSGDIYEVALLDEDFAHYIISISRDKRKQNITENPGEWKKPFNRGTPIVKKLLPENQHHYTIDKMPEVYKALNALGNTRWTVNTRILDLMVEGFEGFSPEISDVEREDALMVLNSYLRDSKRYASWLKNNTDMRSDKRKATVKNKFKTESKDVREVVGEYSVMDSYLRAVYLADAVRDETLYFQHQCDSRGRLYPIAQDLSPQGPDYHKALLLLEIPQKADDFWVKVHIANCAGKDKMSYEDRVSWVEENEKGILFAGNDPKSDEATDFFKRIEIYKEKKTKWQFLACCLEYVFYKYSGFWSIPVGVDATSSGLQFLSAIAKDSGIAEDVNISSCSYAPVGDIYQRIGDSMIDAVDKGKAPSVSHLAAGDKALRKLCKRSAMTFPYSCKGDSMGEHIYEDRGGYGDDSLDTMSFSECSYLGNLQYEVIKQSLPKAAAVMQSMQDIFTDFSGDVEVAFYAPTGFRVTQSKPKLKKEQVAIQFDNRNRIDLVVYTELKAPNTKEHKQGIIANTVHSLDAAMMVKTIAACVDKGVTSFHCVHDQFGADSSNMDAINVEARLAFKEIVDSDPVKRMMEEAVPGRYEQPEQGNWDSKQVLVSKYFLC